MDSEHVILNHLDAPSRILFWPISEFVTVVCPAILLFLLGNPLLGVVAGGLIAWGMRVFKRTFGKGTLEGVLYWYLIPNRSNYPVTPPSYIREYIG